MRELIIRLFIDLTKIFVKSDNARALCFFFSSYSGVPTLFNGLVERQREREGEEKKQREREQIYGA